jgi:alpha-N-arabinofuranosidase
MFDQNLELVAVGSSNAEMPTFKQWERDVLKENVALVDYLSCHIYFYDNGDTTDFLTSSDKLDAFLSEISIIIAEAKASHPDARDVKISLDEWNVWNYHAYDALKETRDFEIAPRILEDEYTLLDAVVVGSLLQTILEHADTVAIAAIAQLVNVIGPIRSEPNGQAWRQTTFYPFAAAALSRDWEVLRAASEDPLVRATVTRSPEGDAYNVHVTNRDQQNTRTLELALHDVEVVDAWALYDDDLHATNTQSDPLRVRPRELVATVQDGTIRVEMPAVSWGFVQLRTREATRA